MDARTLTALKGSIAKWQAIANGTGVDRGMLDCPLCAEFGLPLTKNCKGCPVQKETGRSGCGGTPYVRYVHAEENGDENIMHDAALAELAFLKSLLPEGETV